MKLSLPLDGGVWLVPNTLIDSVGCNLGGARRNVSLPIQTLPHITQFGTVDQSESDLLLYERVELSDLQRCSQFDGSCGRSTMGASLSPCQRSPSSGLTESMSIFVKPKLKALKECLAAKDWEGVHKNAK